MKDQAPRASTSNACFTFFVRNPISDVYVGKGSRLYIPCTYRSISIRIHIICIILLSTKQFVLCRLVCINRMQQNRFFALQNGTYVNYVLLNRIVTSYVSKGIQFFTNFTIIHFSNFIRFFWIFSKSLFQNSEQKYTCIIKYLEIFRREKNRLWKNCLHSA